MRFRAIALFVVCLTAALAGGCGILKKPDMNIKTGIASMNKPARPLIFIHGFLGSKLRDPDTHHIAWGTMSNVLRGGKSDILALSITGADHRSEGDTLEPFELYDSLWGVDYYREILRSLKTAGGYQIGDINNPQPGDNAFLFVYDWRHDNVESARLLSKAIDRLKTAMGRPDQRFDLLSHSQGGLIARYYIKYGGADLPPAGEPFEPTMAGAANVNKVILLGTPNRGTLESLKILHLGVKKGFRPMRPEVVFTMPSVFQMLPTSSTALFADMAGNPVDLDIYDPQVWKRQRWSVFSPETQSRMRAKFESELGDRREVDAAVAKHNEQLERVLSASLRRADRFHKALDAPAAFGPDVAYYAFGGDCIPTLKTAIVMHGADGESILFDHRGVGDELAKTRLASLMFGPGDGTVPMQSLLGIDPAHPNATVADDPGQVSFVSAFFFCASHGVLPNNPIFQNNLFYTLLWQRDEPRTGAPMAVTSN